MEFKNTLFCSIQVLVFLTNAHFLVGHLKTVANSPEPTKCYNNLFWPTVWNYQIRLYLCLQIPFFFFTILGLLYHPAFSNVDFKCKIKSKSNLPFLRLILVTKGTYTKLVMDSVYHHLTKLKQFGWSAYEMVILTETRISGLDGLKRIKLPRNFSTRRSTLYKARNLEYVRHYMKTNNDSTVGWVAVVDEDTRMQMSYIEGIAEYVSQRSPPPIAQGMIIYGKEMNRIFDQQNVTIMANALRTGIDLFPNYGLFMWSQLVPSFPKGGMFLMRQDLHETLTLEYESGLCLTEDVYLGRILHDRGIAWGYVHGVVSEYSTPTIIGHLKQRTYWMRGLLYIGFIGRMGAVTRIIHCVTILLWLQSNIGAVLTPLWYYCLPVDGYMTWVDDMSCYVVASHMTCLVIGVLLNYDFSLPIFIVLAVLHCCCPVISFVLLWVIQLMDLISNFSAVMLFIIEWFGNHMPKRPLTEKYE